MYSLPNPNYLGIMMPDFLLAYNIAPSTYTFLLKVKSKEGLWAFIHGKSRFSGLQSPLGITNGNRSHNKPLELI